MAIKEFWTETVWDFPQKPPNLVLLPIPFVFTTVFDDDLIIPSLEPVQNGLRRKEENISSTMLSRNVERLVLQTFSNPNTKNHSYIQKSPATSVSFHLGKPVSYETYKARRKDECP